jgi:hypothetical protein
VVVLGAFGLFVVWLRNREALQQMLQTAVNPRKEDRP